MWCATNGLNGSLGCGVEAQDWATHMIGHELTAIYGIDHGRTLAIIMPAVHRHEIRRKQSVSRSARNGCGTPIGATRPRAAPGDRSDGGTFFRSVGVPTRLSEYGVDAAGTQVVKSRNG